MNYETYQMNPTYQQSYVTYNFRSTSAFLSESYSQMEEENNMIETQSRPMMHLGVRPGGNPVGELDDVVPIGNMVLPMILMAIGYTLWRKISHLAHMSVKH